MMRPGRGRLWLDPVWVLGVALWMNQVVRLTTSTHPRGKRRGINLAISQHILGLVLILMLRMTPRVEPACCGRDTWIKLLEQSTS